MKCTNNNKNETPIDLQSNTIYKNDACIAVSMILCIFILLLLTITIRQ